MKSSINQGVRWGRKLYLIVYVKSPITQGVGWGGKLCLIVYVKSSINQGVGWEAMFDSLCEVQHQSGGDVG